MSIGKSGDCWALACHCIAIAPQKSFGQAFGVELQASTLPASGGMGGTGIARPQDLQTPLALNPATLSQFKGTQFSFSRRMGRTNHHPGQQAIHPWATGNHSAVRSEVEAPRFHCRQCRSDSRPDRARATGHGRYRPADRFGTRRELQSGHRQQRTAADMQVLQTMMGAGVESTDRLSVGFLGMVGSAAMDGIFAGTTSSTPAYNLPRRVGSHLRVA